jgi:hypothetical protein
MSRRANTNLGIDILGGGMFEPAGVTCPDDRLKSAESMSGILKRL